MASGKTGHLLTEIDTLRKYGNKKIAVFKPLTDTRSGLNRIMSREGDEDSAEEIPVNNPKEMWMILRAKESAAGCRFEVVATRGSFSWSRIFSMTLTTCLRPVSHSIFRGGPFGSTPDLALLAEDRCMWMTAYGTKCGSRAAYPQRIIDGPPAPYNSPQIQVGGDETYEPRCDEYFVLPGRPLPGYNDPQRRIWPAGR
jgi:thymidine kinase